MASSDDEDLKMALALSLQQSPTSAPATAAIIDLTSDCEGEDDDQDLKTAIALSLQEAVRSPDMSRSMSAITGSEQPTSTITVPMAKPTQRTTSITSSANKDTKTATSFLLDRKAMEQERLARLGKRKRSYSPDQPSKQPSKAPTFTATEVSSLSPQIQPESVLQYPTGAIKRTFATKFPRTDDITIDELLQASEINIAVISSFQWDAEWLSRKLRHNKVKQIWVMNAKGSDIQERWRQDLADCGIPNLAIHFPPMDGYIGSAHSKYMLLFGEKKLRVVVTTANMEREYWGEVNNNWQPGVMENSVFVIDLPRRADGAVGTMAELTLFGQELVHFLEGQKLKPNVIEGVLKFDFSRTGRLAFVHSIGGTYDEISSHPTGLPGLSKAVQDLHLDGVGSLELDYAASSLGAITETFLQRIYLAAQGLPFTTVSNVTSHIERKFRIHYPTEETIKTSIGGPDCAGIISLKKAHYSSHLFPAACLRDHVSTRKGMISHSKLLFARGRHINHKPFAWVYVGSANVSESAWGAQKVLKNGRMGKLSIRNWECGVIVPVPTEKLEVLKLEKGVIPPMSVFEGTIEVPFHCPGEPYNGRTPHLWNT